MLAVRPSLITDLPRILALRDAARDIMLRTGNAHQWPAGYPSDDTFRRDVEQGVSYVVEDDGNICGTFVLAPGPEPTYRTISHGQWLDDTAPYMVIHRIASTPESHGVFKTIITFARQQSNNLRIDTHRDNRIMRRLIGQHGFAYCGVIHLENGDPRLAYQWIQQ